MNSAKLIDHTLLKPESTRTQIDQIIDEAKAYNFKSVCVNPTHVKYAAERLADSGVLVCTVIGFPLGASPPAKPVEVLTKSAPAAFVNSLAFTISSWSN